MWIIRLFRYIFGYVLVAFSGDFCERMLNLCAKNHITLWNIKRKDDKIFANISVKNFKNVRKVRGKSRVKIKIIKKIGIPFIFKKYKFRIGIPVGFAVFIGILIFLQLFVWQIYIVGNENTSQQTILNACDKLGIRIGTPIKNINTLKQKEELLLNLDSLAWVSLNIEGCRLTINVSEIRNENAHSSQPSNLYAKFDGVIEKITVKSGVACVKPGDAVLKGDLLVSGKNELINAGVIEYTQSQAQVLAVTEHTFSTKIKKRYIELTKTGKEKQKKVLNFFGINIPLYLGNVKTPYIYETTDKTLTLFKEKMPLSIRTKKFFELEFNEISLTKEQAIKKARIQ